MDVTLCTRTEALYTVAPDGSCMTLCGLSFLQGLRH